MPRMPGMGTHSVVGPIRYRVGSWRVYATGDWELLSVVTDVIMGVGMVVGVVGWVEARCPS